MPLPPREPLGPIIAAFALGACRGHWTQAAVVAPDDVDRVDAGHGVGDAPEDDLERLVFIEDLESGHAASVSTLGA
jgi:hypothetical protein